MDHRVAVNLHYVKCMSITNSLSCNGAKLELLDMFIFCDHLSVASGYMLLVLSSIMVFIYQNTTQLLFFGHSKAVVLNTK